MADIQINPLGNVKAPDITGPVQVGFGIAQGRQRAQREQQKIDAAKEQLIVENARLADAAKEASNERMFNSGIALLNVSKSRNNVDMGKEGVRMLFKSMGVDDKISNGINVTQEMVDDAIAIGKAKDGSPEEEIEENIFMEKYKIALSDFLATQSGEFSGLEEVAKGKKEIAKEERAQTGKIELERIKAGLKVPKQFAPQLKLFQIGKELKFLDAAKPLPKGAKPFIKQPAGKPFKQGQMLLFKEGSEGQPPEVKGLKTTDGSVNIDMFNKLLEEGFETEDMIKRRNPSLADQIIEGLRRDEPKKPVSKQKKTLLNDVRKKRFDELKAINENATDTQINNIIDFEESQ